MKFLSVAGGVLAYIAAVILFTYHPAAEAECWTGRTLCLSPNDMGAFLSGIFAPLAFAWLAWSVVMQSKELALQREELKLTRQEMAEARSVAEETGQQVRAQAEAMTAQTEFLKWQFNEQQLDSKEREIHRLFDALYALMKTSIVGSTILRIHGSNTGSESIAMLDRTTVERTDGLPSHIALGMMHSQFKSRMTYALGLIGNAQNPSVQLFHKEELERVWEVINWIKAAELEARSAVRTDVFSAKIDSYFDIVEQIMSFSVSISTEQ